MRIFLSTFLEPISFSLYLFGLLYYFFRIDRNKAVVWLCIYYGLATALMLRVSIGMGLKIETVNTQFYNLLYLFSGLFMGGYFFLLLKRPWKRAGALAVSLGTLVYYIVNSVVNTQPYFDSIGYALASVGIVTLLFIHLQQHLQQVTEQRLVMNFTFWFSCVLLFYYLGAFAIFLSYNYFTYKLMAGGNKRESIDILTYLWMVHNVILFLGGLVTVYGIVWISRRKFTSS